MKLTPRHLIVLGPIHLRSLRRSANTVKGGLQIWMHSMEPCGVGSCADTDGESGIRMASGFGPGSLSGTPVLEAQFPSSLSTSMPTSTSTSTCARWLPRSNPADPNRVRMGSTPASPAPFASAFPLALQRATFNVCDWNFAVTPASSMSRINAGARHHGALFLF